MSTKQPGTHLSVSQIKIADMCSLKWHYKYRDQLPAPEDAAAKIFGSVFHNGVEHWYGDAGSDTHQRTSLRDHVHEEWFVWLPQDVAIELRHCIACERELAELEQAVKLARPKLVAPRSTKDFLTSSQHKRFEDARDGLLAAAAKCEDVRWAKDENAFQAWQKSMFMANQLQARWQRLPRPVLLEREFVIEFAGVEVRGRIDQIRREPDPIGIIHTTGVDLKTGRRLMSQMEAFLQAFLYNEACYQDPDLPEPDIWTFWMVRHNKPQHGRIDRERHGKLATRILKRVQAQIKATDYAPHFGIWCDWCDYRGICEQEISMWPPGQEGIVLEPVGVQAA